MDVQNEQNGSGDKALDNLVIIMAVVLFFGTAQVMSTHAPKIISDVLGFDASYLFGVVCATCVEWGALRLHFNPAAQRNVTAKVVKWILLFVSGLCQVYNAAIATGTLSQLSETLKIGFTWLVPNIPLMFIVLMFWIGSLTDRKQPTLLDKVTDKGLTNMLPKMGDILYGKHRVSSSVSSPTATLALDVKQEAQGKTNHKDKTKANPT